MTAIKAADVRARGPETNGAASASLHTVTELAGELGVSPRTLRFYEDKGLITPSRVGTTRVYMARDRARMILILRGKRLGFSLREIAEYLDLYDIDPTQRAQSERLLGLVSARMTKLNQQRQALDEMLAELEAWKKHALSVLKATTRSPVAGTTATQTLVTSKEPT